MKSRFHRVHVSVYKSCANQIGFYVGVIAGGAAFWSLGNCDVLGDDLYYRATVDDFGNLVKVG